MKLNPWIARTLQGFTVFNLAIGVTLFFYYPKVAFTVISAGIPQPLWASIFMASGLIMAYGLLTHKYHFLRHMMVFGLFLKTLWEIGLLFRLSNGAGILSVELWGMIAYLQLLGVIYFMPEHYYGRS